MATLADRLYAQAQITPIRPANRVKSVEKTADGSLKVLTHGGEDYTISADDLELQAFAIYTVLNEDACR